VAVDREDARAPRKLLAQCAFLLQPPST